jgi:hypothetical protein
MPFCSVISRGILLAGVLLDAVAMKDAATKEGWRRRGAAFFQS